jgi:anaerobic dimethyl sulfoxide reductase subunit A
MSHIMKQVNQKARGISRRDFLKGSMAATAAIAGLSLAGCDSASVQESDPSGETSMPESSMETPAEHPEITDACEGGEWVPAACWLNCGGGCPNYAYVKDGVVIRQKSDTTHEDTPDFPQQRSCLRGRSQSKVVFGADRLKYPMKRKHWEPFTGGDRELRGKDEWERISWDEALDLVAAELRHAKEDAGNESILLPSFGAIFCEFYKTMLGFGGYLNIRDTASTGTYSAAGLYGADSSDMFTANDRFDLCKSETIVLYGCNPSWSSLGNPSSYLLRAKEGGSRFVFVGPGYNETASRMNAEWIPVRPGTDTAFMLAVAYEMLRLDEEEGGLIDWDFLARCTVGFDADHMPADASLTENFKDYVLGKYDDTPKTPEWATEICGTPTEKITWFAKTLGKEHKVALLHSYAAARANGAENVPQLFMTLGAMGGHFGKEGHCCGSAYHRNAGNDSGLSCLKTTTCGVENAAFAASNTVTYSLDAPHAWQAILDGKYTPIYQWSGALLNETPEDKEIKINVLYNCWRNPMQTIPGIGTCLEALKKIPTVITHAFSLNLSAEYADIVLPITTQWERMGDYFYRGWGCREWQPFPSRVTEPLYEAWSDQKIGYELAKRLGLDSDTLYPISEEQNYFNVIATAQVMTEDGTGFENMVSITEEDAAALKEKWGVDLSVQEGKMGIQDLLKQGLYAVERREGDHYGGIKYAKFVQDPDSDPRPTPSGRFEIYSQTKADTINRLNNGEIKPYPNYIRPVNGYEDTFSDWEKKVKGDYPYQIYNPHYIRRAHTGFDNVAQLREVAPNPVFINASDAAEKGIKDGDIVRIWNKYGTVLRTASTSERLMPGCLGLPHGTWTRFDENGFDYSGSDNVICAPESQLINTSGYNTNLCNFEKYDGTLEPDYTWPQKIVEF